MKTIQFLVLSVIVFIFFANAFSQERGNIILLKTNKTLKDINIKEKITNITKPGSGFTGYISLGLCQSANGLPTGMGWYMDIALGNKFNDNFALLGKLDFTIFKKDVPFLFGAVIPKTVSTISTLAEFQGGFFNTTKSNIYGFGYVDIGYGFYHLEDSEKTPSGIAFESGICVGFKFGKKDGLYLKVGYGSLNADGNNYSFFPISIGVSYIP